MTTDISIDGNGSLEVVIIFENDTDFLDTNLSDASKYPVYFHGYTTVILLSLLMISFMILAIGGNVMVILTIIRHRGMRTRTNIFIINLAVADILVAFLDMPFSLATVLEGRWIFGNAMCQLNGFTMALFLICSIHTLMYISVHKFISITRPFSRAMTPKRIKMMIAATWIWSVICAVGPLIGWNSIGYKMGASQCGPNIPKNFLDQSHSLFITATNYMLPLGVMSFCYWRIFQEINNHMDRIRETSNINMASSVQQQKKVSVTLLLVLACFLICWSPYVLYATSAALLKDEKKLPYYVNPVAYWFGYMNSACNPIIYAFRSPSFRKGYKEIMCGKAAPGLSGVHSLSFRSRSGRGSLKSNQASNQFACHSGSRKNSQVVAVRGGSGKYNRGSGNKRMLSQTSWMSLPIIPFIIRTFSSASEVKPPRNAKGTKNVEDTKHVEDKPRRKNVAEWGHCLCCSSDMSDDEVEEHRDTLDRHGEIPTCLDGPELNGMDAEEDNCLTSDGGRRPNSIGENDLYSHLDADDERLGRIQIVGDEIQEDTQAQLEVECL